MIQDFPCDQTLLLLAFIFSQSSFGKKNLRFSGEQPAGPFVHLVHFSKSDGGFVSEGASLVKVNLCSHSSDSVALYLRRIEQPMTVTFDEFCQIWRSVVGPEKPAKHETFKKFKHLSSEECRLAVKECFVSICSADDVDTEET